MRIKSVRIKNFRAFADVTVHFDNYTCLVGANGAGKSTVLCALNVFFREATNATDVQALTIEDYHKKNTEHRVEITVTFHHLPEAAKADLSDYVRGDELIVSAVAEFDAGSGRGRVRQVGSRMGMQEFTPFFKAFETETASNLGAMFEEYRLTYPDIAQARSKGDRKEALIAFEQSHKNLLVPLESEDTFYGIGGTSKLRNHMQWVYVPAVKDASQEQSDSRDSALGKLLARTVRAQVDFRAEIGQLEEETRNKYAALMSTRQGALDAVGAALSQRLAQWCHPEAAVRLAWNPSPISIKDPAARATGGEAEFEGDLARFGHGFQRSYLIALLQELSATDDADGPTLILGCEEPELYQHPPQARHLAQVLQELSERNAQVCVTTHSPYFVGGKSFESVRMVHKGAGALTSVRSTTFQNLARRYAEVDGSIEQPPTAVAAQIGQMLRPQLNEMFFARRIVLVEGSEDVAYILSWMALSNRINAFRSRGVHVVPTDGKSHLVRPLLIAQQLGISVAVVFDSDRSQQGHARFGPMHRADNRRLLHLLGLPDADIFPSNDVWHADFVQWADELGSVVDQELRHSLGDENFTRTMDQARLDCGNAASLEKNTLLIEKKLTRAREAGGLCPSLDRLCEFVLG